MILRVTLAAAGIVALALGSLAVRRVMRWTPRVSADLTSYEPGPDVIDWAEALAPGLIGILLLLTAIAV